MERLNYHLNEKLIYRYVQLLDKYFGSVCYLSYVKVYFILDELLVGGEIQETSKKKVLKATIAQDVLQEYASGEAQGGEKYGA